MIPVLSQLRQGLIVSCQAEAGFPLNKPQHLAAMAASAVMGGAKAIRASGPDNIRAIRQAVDVPIIGIYKKDYPGFEVRITPTLSDITKIVDAGADIIALDATHRPRPDGQSLESLLHAYQAQFNLPLMADISTVQEGIVAAQLGADLVATTLSGYTADTKAQTGPDIQLIRDLAAAMDVPVIAEGRIANPQDACEALAAGAYAVVVGSMITRPHLITRRFATAIHSYFLFESVLALDIGGTKIVGGVINGENQVVLEDEVPTSTQEGGPAILKQVVDLLASLQKQHAVSRPVAIGVSTGGQIDDSGHIISATNMIPNWTKLPLKERITHHFGLPTFILNDGHAATLAEYHLGAGQGNPSMLCVVIGTGLGGGLMINGQLQPGVNGLAGSIGQIKISPDGETYLSLERLVSGPALVQAYNRHVSTRAFVNTGQEVTEKAEAGDEVARQTIMDMGDWLGLGLSHALHTFDAACVVVGGSVAQIGALLFNNTRHSLQRHGHSTVAHTPVLPAMLGPRAGLIGAALFAKQQFVS